MMSRIRPQAASTFEVVPVHSIPEALMALRTSPCEVIVISCGEPDASVDDTVLEIRRVAPDTPLIVDCERIGVAEAVHLTKLGASDVWSGSVGGAQMVEDLHAAAQMNETAREAAPSRERWCDALVGESDPMLRVFDVIRLVASRRSTVLITGETGTGKEVVARAIHAAGGRDRLPFVAVNCAAIPENLIESELFGHAKGAFTGASQSRPGRFEQANGGTLFLDEIGELAPSMQVKLLRVLQEREVQRLGSNDPIRLNIRVIAATNVDLDSAVRARTFRQDLYYRLNVVPLHLPPLRERMADLPLLVAHFLEKICRSERMGRKAVSAAALDRLALNDWPGNIRQLEHAIEMAMVLSGDRPVLEESDFAMLKRMPGMHVSGAAPLVHVPDEGLDFDETVTRIERSILRQALAKSGGNKARAAELLRMKRTTLLAKMKSFEDGDLRDALSFPPRIGVCQRVFAAVG
jgi:DNA-binding NtrC family response regulator